MYRLMIVDNEAIERKALKILVSKNFATEIHEIREAKNGHDAVVMAKSFKPHLVLMDIQMPVLDGLEASEQIKAMNPECEIIILTAFDYFDYAKKAIKLQVLDYLLKPVSESKLEELITKTLAAIKRKETTQSVLNQHKNKMNELEPYITKTFLHDMANKSLTVESYTNYLTLLGITHHQYVCLIIEQDHPSPIEKKVVQSIQHKLKYVFPTVMVESYYGRVVVLIYLHSMEIGNFENIIENITRDINQLFVENHHPLVHIGISKLYEEASGISKVYEEALDALHDKKYMDKKISGTKLEAYPIVAEKAIYDALVYQDLQSALNNFETIVDYLKQVNDFTFSQLAMKQLSFMLHRNLLCKFGRYRLKEDVNVLMASIDACQDMDRVQACMKDYFKVVCKGGSLTDESRSQQIIDEAKRYIDENFCTRACSLNDVAEMLEISPTYLSRLFKKAANINFKDYIIEKRLERAKHLLATTKMTTKEISHEIGYDDPNYFSRAFKKYEGIPATLYARRVRM